MSVAYKNRRKRYRDQVKLWKRNPLPVMESASDGRQWRLAHLGPGIAHVSIWATVLAWLRRTFAKVKS